MTEKEPQVREVLYLLRKILTFITIGITLGIIILFIIGRSMAIILIPIDFLIMYLLFLTIKHIKEETKKINE